MSNRGCLILWVFLALAGNLKPAFAQPPALLVRIYDDADLKPKAFHELASRTQEILVHTGLSVEVEACQKDLSPCEGSDGSPSARQVIVRVLAGDAKTMKYKLRPPLGQAFTDADGGTCASVFLGRVQKAANDVGVPWITVLSYAAAHEIGHLLLGKDSHTPSGLMKANWDRKDLRAMDECNLYFSSDQARKLASQYGGVRQTVASAEASLPSRQ
jgi:hypothetical protein